RKIIRVERAHIGLRYCTARLEICYLFRFYLFSFYLFRFLSLPFYPCSSVCIRGSTSKQARLPARRFEAEMFIGEGCRRAAALRAIAQAELHQVRFVDLLDGIFFLADGSRKGAEPH